MIGLLRAAPYIAIAVLIGIVMLQRGENDALHEDKAAAEEQRDTARAKVREVSGDLNKEVDKSADLERRLKATLADRDRLRDDAAARSTERDRTIEEERNADEELDACLAMRLPDRILRQLPQ